MGQELLYKVTKGDITKDAYWEMMNRIIEISTRELYNCELNNAYVTEVKRRLHENQTTS